MIEASETKAKIAGRNNFLKVWRSISDLKLPANPNLVSNITQRLEDNSYEDSSIALVADLKKDIALFCYCLKKEVERCKFANISTPSKVDSVSLLERLEFWVLKEIVENSIEELSDQDFDSLNELQASCLQGVLAALAAVEAIAKERGVNSNLAFSTSLLKQLPHLLIAWKFPDVYTHTIATAFKDGKALLDTFNLQLKFPFSFISSAVGNQWSILPILRMAIGDPVSSNIEIPKADLEQLEDIQEICEIGEMLARANNPQAHATAGSDWKTAKGKIEDYGGTELLKATYEQVKNHTEPYIDYAPLLFQHNLETSFERQLGIISGGTSYQRNRYIKECPREVRQKLKEIYDNLDSTFIFRSDVRQLLFKVVPLAGFNRGCIYNYSPMVSKLVPQLSLGSSQISNFQSINCSRLNPEQHPAYEAYKVGGQVVFLNEWGVIPTTCIVGVLGPIQKAGVLFLQASPELSILPEERVLTLYHALNRTLVDILKLY